jgi:hypothetical protein
MIKAPDKRDINNATVTSHAHEAELYGPFIVDPSHSRFFNSPKILQTQQSHHPPQGSFYPMPISTKQFNCHVTTD